ncbi:MAG: hypothetical protein ACRDCI_01955 [Plesiomonas shigelloides]
MKQQDDFAEIRAGYAEFNRNLIAQHSSQNKKLKLTANMTRMTRK